MSNKRRGVEETEEEKLHSRWALLMEQLGIHYTDQYERFVSDYLQSGLVDRSAVDDFIVHFCRDHERAEAQGRAKDFFQWTFWNLNLGSAEIIDRAEQLSVDVRYLDCYTVTSLYDYLITLDGCKPLANDMVANWVEHLKELATSPDADPAGFLLGNWPGRPLHPSIVTAFGEARKRLEQPRSLLDVCLDLAHKDGWSTADQIVMQNASIEDFKDTIFSLNGEHLKIFMLKNLDIYAHRATYERNFGNGPQNFYEACCEINRERSGTRWSKFIENLFRDANLALEYDVDQK